MTAGGAVGDSVEVAWVEAASAAVEAEAAVLAASVAVDLAVAEPEEVGSGFKFL